MMNRRDFGRNSALGLVAFAVPRGPELNFANPCNLPIGIHVLCFLPTAYCDRLCPRWGYYSSCYGSNG
jgi:hypothetical protein